MQQREIVCLDQVISASHRYRDFLKIWNFREVDKKLLMVKTNKPHEGYSLPLLFRCLLLQFLEGLSDRELNVFLQENMAGKWFCSSLSLKGKHPMTIVCAAMRKLLHVLFGVLKKQSSI